MNAVFVSIDVSTSPTGLASGGDTAQGEDIALLREMAGGEPRALADLHRRHAKLLLTIAVRILGNRSDAEEVLQESLFYAWRIASRYDPARSSVTSWLALIVRSRSLDRQRSSRAERRKRFEVGRETRDRCQSPAAYDQVLEVQRRRRVREALRRLPPEQREVLDLAYYRGFTHQQIAEHTGIPLGTAKTRILLAMKRLRRQLRPEIRSLLH